MRQTRLALLPLMLLLGCGETDPRAEVRAQWAADSARYAMLDCGMVPLDEGDECRRVNSVLRRRAASARSAPVYDGDESPLEELERELRERSSRGADPAPNGATE